MDTKQIEYILKIAEENNITKAAEKLFISQSALNQQLLKLEKELGTPLFNRVRNAWSPTYAGEVYIETAKTMLELKKTAYARIGDIAGDRTGRLVIGFPPEHGTMIFSKVYPIFHKRHPNIMIETKEARSKTLEACISHGELDFAFTSFPSDMMTANLNIPLLTEELVLAVPITHPLASNASPLSGPLQTCLMKDFEDSPFILASKDTTIRTMTDKLFEQAHFHPHILLETSNTFAIINMVSTGICSSVVPLYYAKTDGKTAYFSLPGKPIWNLSASYRKDGYLTQAALDFIELTHDFLVENYYNTLGNFKSFNFPYNNPVTQNSNNCMGTNK